MSQPYDIPLPFDDEELHSRIDPLDSWGLYDDDPFVSDSLLRYNDIHDYVWEEEDE